MEYMFVSVSATWLSVRGIGIERLCAGYFCMQFLVNFLKQNLCSYAL